MKTRNAEILLAAVIIARSTSFMMSKAGLDAIEPMNMMAIRFTIAFIIMAVIFGRRLTHINTRTFISGLLVGVAYLAVMVAEMMGLNYTDSSRIAFLENAAIVYVPLMEASLTRHLPAPRGLLCSFMAITGVGFLSLSGGLTGFGIGEALGVLSGILYGIAIIVTDRFTEGTDGLLVGIIEIGTMALGAWIISFAIETPVLPDDPVCWALILALATVCTCFGWTLQPLAQKYVSTERTSMFLAFSPLSAALLGVIFLHESLGAGGIAGGALIMIGILLQTVFTIREGKNGHTENNRQSQKE